MKKILITLSVCLSILFTYTGSVAQEFNDTNSGSNWFDNIPSTPGTYVYGDNGDWYSWNDVTLLEEVVVHGTRIHDFGDTNNWGYNSGSDYWTRYNDYNDSWDNDNPYDYYNIDPPYGDTEVNMGVVNKVATVASMNGSIYSLAADISTVVDNLNVSQLKVLTRFAQVTGIASAVIGTIQVVYSVTEEGEFDMNDALATAGVVLGVVGVIASGPIGVAIGVGSLVFSLYAASGSGEDWCLISCG